MICHGNHSENASSASTPKVCGSRAEEKRVSDINALGLHPSHKEKDG
jgi:hypothetical protein